MAKKHPLDLPDFLNRKLNPVRSTQADRDEYLERWYAAHPKPKQIEEQRPTLEPVKPTRATNVKEKVMAKSAKTTKTPKAKKAEGEGYKGHRAGSNIGQLHECFDKHGEEAARKLGTKLGLKDSTLSIQFSRYRNEAGRPKAKSTKKPVKGKSAKKPVKSKSAKGNGREREPIETQSI